MASRGRCGSAGRLRLAQVEGVWCRGADQHRIQRLSSQPNSSDHSATSPSSRAGLKGRRADFTPLCQRATLLPCEEPA